MTMRRRRLSLAILLASAATMIAMSGARYIGDASFWTDEAGVAYNVISMNPVELLGPLDTGHQFPRLYLAVINQLRLAFGYETMVLRALPFAFFVAGVLLWHRLLWLRFRTRPALLVLGIAATLVPGDWFAYGAMFKQYSLDVFVALLPFLLSDEELDRCWRRGEGATRVLFWVLPCLVSLSYGIALLGRMVGYVLGTWRAQGGRLDARTLATFAVGFAGVMAASFAIDVRHAFSSATTVGFWRFQGCIATGDPLADVSLLGRWLVDWYVGLNPFGSDRPVHGAVVALLLAGTALGAVRVLREAWRVGPGVGSAPVPGPSAALEVDESRDRAAWGTRALSALVTIGGLWAAGLLFSYPLCANRLTLFAFFSLVLVGLEGFGWLTLFVERRVGRIWPELLPLIVAAALTPSVASTMATLFTEDAPENVRSLLPIIATEPERPIVVARCTGLQGLTLPEWIGRGDIVFVDERLGLGEPALPDLEEFWLVSTGGQAICLDWTRRLRARASSFRPATARGTTAMLSVVTMPAAGAESDAGEAGVTGRRSRGASDPPR